MEKPVDITDEQWDKSKKRARSFLIRAFNTFPDKSKPFYIQRVESFIKADLFTIKTKGAL
jgi:hypothetical protein